MRDSSLSWQKKLAEGFSRASELLEFLELPVSLAAVEAEQQFASRIPMGFALRMKKGAPDDPLLKQVLAVGEELVDRVGYTQDPLEELQANPVKGVLHKYHGRVLLTLTGACAVNCRYCFRRHFPYQDNNPGRSGWKSACEYIRQDPSIHEVILSGGDPLLASNLVIGELISELETMPHLRTLRIHTRIPIVLPERIDEEFIRILKGTRLKKVVVVHSNHPNEIDETVQTACTALRQANCYLLNQSVLLKGVNDDAEVLAQLSHSLFNLGIMPYYLHVLDKVQGAAHFDLSWDEVSQLYGHLQSLLPGYLLPRLAREEPGKRSKTLLISGY